MVKPHGLRGLVVAELWTNRTERMHPGEAFESSQGRLVLRSASVHGHRWLLSFEGVEDLDSAERLRSVVLLAEPLQDPAVLWIHDLVGSMLYDSGGTCWGRVTAVEANPASDLLVLEDGTLVPLRFVVSSGDGRIVVEAPEGLFG